MLFNSYNYNIGADCVCGPLATLLALLTVHTQLLSMRALRPPGRGWVPSKVIHTEDLAPQNVSSQLLLCDIVIVSRPTDYVWRMA